MCGQQVVAPDAAALPEGGIIVQNKFAGVNYLEVIQRNGQYPFNLGGVPGIEGAGLVVASRNAEFQVGDRVGYVIYPGGAYAEYIQINNPGSVVKLPEGVSYEQAAAALISGLTTVGIYRYAHETKPDQTVLVWAAAGGAGQALVQFGKNVVGARVIGVTSSEEKARVVKTAGADDVIVHPRGPFTGERIEDHPVVKRVFELTGGQGVDAVFDGVGADTFDASLASLALHGSVVVFGHTSGVVPPVDPKRLAARNARLLWHLVFTDVKDPARFSGLTTELFDSIAQNKFVQPVYRVYDLADAAQAHADLEQGKSHGKLLLRL
ncbi:putative zinc binding dehydrogenase [Ramicandelaber brevisporus]|nr:putative zinc binding dehydrogenase [Ramicandelaber brevisporus]